MELAFYKTHCESLEDEQPCSSNQLVNQPTNPNSDQDRIQENTATPTSDQDEKSHDNVQINALDISHNANDQINTPDISHIYSDQNPLIPKQHLNRIPNKKLAIILIVIILIILACILILIYKNKVDEMQTSTSSMTSALPTTTTSSMTSALSTTTISTTTPTIKCPDGSKWFYYNKTNACYYVDQGTISWHTAQHDCRKLNNRSNLASIICQAEDEFILSITSSIYPHPSKIAIGLHAPDATLGLLSYEWVDKMALNYTNLRTDPTQDINEHCVFKEISDGKWNWNIESACTMEIPIIYVCKIKLH
uniref:C-type lectin domain-containing protein n=1 Tax=Acrobeloides nanus TaxID=290746 RepID=A0A914EFA3_9BILA